VNGRSTSDSSATQQKKKKFSFGRFGCFPLSDLFFRARFNHRQHCHKMHNGVEGVFVQLQIQVLSCKKYFLFIFGLLGCFPLSLQGVLQP